MLAHRPEPITKNDNSSAIWFDKVANGGQSSSAFSSGGWTADERTLPTIIYVPNAPTGPTPGPAPCSGTATPCPTPRAPFATTGLDIDPAAAALTACSVAAPPMLQVGCDLEQFREAVDSGDPVEIVANGFGFIWYLGDGVKYFVKGGKAIFEVPEELAAVRLLTSGPAGKVTRNALEPHEYEQALDVVAFRGGHLEGPPVRRFPGIDGRLDGKPISLKVVREGGMGRVLNDVKDARKEAANAGYAGVDVYVRALGVDMRSAGKFVADGYMPSYHKSGVIDWIYIQTSDGWVIVPGA